MAASSYDAALAHVLAHEGGYTNHPSDPGGPTNYGITLADYRKYVKADATAADVRAMAITDAKAIYRRRYWDAQRCDELPAGVDYAVFDYGVNSGPGRSGKVLRRVLKLPDTSSAVTDETIRAADAADAAAIIAAICDERLRFLKSLKTWPVFGTGWSRRVANVRQEALALAAAPTKTLAIAKRGPAGGAAVVIAGAAVLAKQNDFDPAIVAAAVLAVVALAVAGWWLWRSRRPSLQEN